MLREVLVHFSLLLLIDLGPSCNIYRRSAQSPGSKNTFCHPYLESCPQHGVLIHWDFCQTVPGLCLEVLDSEVSHKICCFVLVYSHFGLHVLIGICLSVFDHHLDHVSESSGVCKGFSEVSDL